MLRWCQSTVRALDGCGTNTVGAYTFRFQSSAAACRTAFGHGLRRRTGAAPRAVTQAVGSPLRYFVVARRIISTARTLPATGPAIDHEAAAFIVSEPLAAEYHAPQLSGTPSPVDSDAIEGLSNFLSPQNLSSPNPHKRSSDNLKTLYNSLKARDQLRRLSSKQLTELLSLFGSLSLPPPRNPCIYLSKFVSLVDGEDDNAPHWAFVLEIARDKENLLGQSLNGTDRYWVMRAQLTKVVLGKDESLEPNDPRLRALSQATMQYLRIWRHTPDPEIHVPYLQALLSLRSPEHIASLIQRLCKVLELHANPHLRLVDLLWQVLLRHGHQLSLISKTRVLSMVTVRLSRFTSATPVKLTSSPSKKIPLTLGKWHKAPAHGAHELSVALGSTLYPGYFSTSPRPPSAEIYRWAVLQARLAFQPDVSPKTRWGNLLLLAIYRAPHLPVPERVTPPPPEDAANIDGDMGENAEAADWRPVLVLAALEQTLRGGGRGSGGSRRSGTLSEPEAREGIRNIVRPLWRMWKSSGAVDHETRTTTLPRTIVAMFLRVAGQVMDGPLTEGCHRFCVTRGLFGGGEAESDAERLQVVALRAAYVLAAAACQGTTWHDVWERSMPSDNGGEVAEALLWHFLAGDLHAAYGVYTFAKAHDYRLSDRAIRALGLGLVSSRAWHLAVPFLNLALPREHAEELLVAILRVFQAGRREYIDPAFAKALGNTLQKLYVNKAPQNCFKYPIRFFFPIMIASGYPARAISIVEAIHRHAPSFFTIRYFLRLMRTLVRFRHLHLTHTILRLVPNLPTGAADDFRRKVTMSLARAGAHTAARRVHRSGTQHKGWRTARECMTRAVVFKVRSPSAKHTLSVMSILARNPTHSPTIKYAAILLVRANRISAARKLFERARPHLDRKTSTAIGNTILHAFLKQHRLRNGRLVRHTLRTKDVLEKQYGFAPDRVTINIIVKAVLRWRQAIDPDKVKALFDHMVRCGYPAPVRWCLPNNGSSDGVGRGVPFGTPLAPPAFNVPALEQPISFERHVRPMYKMFVKALYVRQDVRAARMVLGILKEEEVLAMKRREERNRARWQGLVRKKIKERGRERESIQDKGGDGLVGVVP